MSTRSKIESILLVASRPLGLVALAKLLEITKKELVTELESLRDSYQEEGRGIELALGTTEVQLVSSPGNAELVKKFLKEEITGELTRPSLETLTIIAYRGPIGKAELEQVRGVNCSLILRNLLIRGLVVHEDDKKTRQRKYSVTVEFLKFLGISQVQELPEYDKLSSHEAVEDLLKSN